jgi:hypothetical protein
MSANRRKAGRLADKRLVADREVLMLVNGFIISRRKNSGVYVIRHADRSIATIVTNVKAALPTREATAARSR